MGDRFVPILNLFRPWKITEEIWWGSTPHTDGVSYKRGQVARPVRGWFFLLIASGVMARVAGEAETVAGLRTLAASDVLHIASGFCGIWMIKKVTEMQEVRWAKVSSSEPLAVAPI